MRRSLPFGLQLACMITCIVPALAQPEVRVSLGLYEKFGIAGGYSLKRTRFDFGSAFRFDHNPASDYIAMAHPWPSFLVQQAAFNTFSDNTWQENTTILTARVLRMEKGNFPKFRLYYGVYVRCIITNAAPDKEGWSNADNTFEDNHRMPVSYKDVNVIAGLVFGVRGQIKGNVFWDANIGFKLIPWFYQYTKLSYNDGTSDQESFQKAGYQYYSPGDLILQVGLGYRFARRVAKG